MSNEEMEKVMNFLIQRQEVFAENLERIEGVVATLVDSHVKLAEAQIQSQRDIATLAQALTRLTKEQGQ